MKDICLLILDLEKILLWSQSLKRVSLFFRPTNELFKMVWNTLDIFTCA